MSYTIQIRRDLAANWSLKNSILASGEIGIETDTLKAKVGNGSAAWASLPYWNPAGDDTLANVNSVFGRTGAVVAASGDYAVGQVTGAAPLASPALSGTPTAPTAAALDNSTKLATTAYADAAVEVEELRALAAEALLAPLAGVAFTGPVSISESAAAGGILTVVNSHTTPTSPSVQYTAQTAADLVLGVNVTGDTQERFQIDSNGKLYWGSGSAAADTTLFRVSTGTIGTGGLKLNTSSAAGQVLQAINAHSAPTSPNVVLTAAAAADSEVGIQVSGDTQYRLTVDSNGLMKWGPGNASVDTSFGRFSSGVIASSAIHMSGSLSSSAVLGVTNNQSGPANPSAQLVSASAGDLEIGGEVSGDADFRWTIDSNGQVSWGSGSAATDVTLNRSTAHTLTVTGHLNTTLGSTAGGILAVTNSTSAPTSPNAQFTAQAAADPEIGVKVNGDTQYRLTIDSNGKMLWGPGGSTAGDSNLYRMGGGLLGTDQGFRAQALSTTGLSGAQAASRYVGATASGAPTSGTFNLGDYVIDQTGALWVCLVAGTPGTWTEIGGYQPWTNTDQGFLAYNFDPGLAGSTSTPAAGILYMMRVNIRAAITWTNVCLVVTSAGSGASSGSYVGLYNSSGTLLSGSADVGGAGNLTANGFKQFALTTPQALSAGTFVWVGVLTNLATTQPTLMKSSSYGYALNALLTTSNFRMGQYGAGQTTLPASVTLSSVSMTSNNEIWIGST